MTRPTRPWARLVPLGFVRRGRRVVRSGDGGATLIYALIFITIASVALGAILAFADTSERTTIALRNQAAQGAAADGAAQIAINNLRQGTYSGGTCANIPIPNFYQATNGAGSYSATVTCTQDTTDSTGGGGPGSGLDLPDDAILTLSRDAGETGLQLKANGSQNAIKIKGPVFSNSDIQVDALVSTSRVTARGTCSSGITAIPLTCGIGNTPNPPGSADPDYAKPTASTAPQSVPSCRPGSNKRVTFSPGLYTDLTGLNDLTRHGGGGCNDVLWFPAGVYYFNFDGTWTIDSGYVVGGTPPGGGTMPDGVPSIPGACQSPVPPDPLPPGG